MLPLDQLTCEMFTPLIGQAFQSQGVALTLHAARVLGHKHEAAAREPFSLLLRGPQGLRLEQGIHRFNHPLLGELEIFITQVADGHQGSEFEAIFT